MSHKRHDLMPELESSPEGGNGNQIQYLCQYNPMDRGTWWATVGGDAKSQLRLKWLSMHARFEDDIIFIENCKYFTTKLLN